LAFTTGVTNAGSVQLRVDSADRPVFASRRRFVLPNSSGRVKAKFVWSRRTKDGLKRLTVRLRRPIVRATAQLAHAASVDHRSVLTSREPAIDRIRQLLTDIDSPDSAEIRPRRA
jgi:hypothetical protein